MRPVPGTVTAAYRIKGGWAAGYHTGIDYRAPVGTPCKAAAGGKVIHAGRVGWGPAYGIQVVTQATIGGTIYRLLYAHLSSVSVSVGQTITTGQTIGRTGATGNVTGPHLHFEVRRSPYTYGRDVNPSVAVNVPEKSGGPAVPSRVANARKDLQAAVNKLDRAVNQGKRGQAVKLTLTAARDALNRCPKK